MAAKKKKRQRRRASIEERAALKKLARRRLNGPKRLKRGKGSVSVSVSARATTRYICPVDGRTIGRKLLLTPDNRWLCECPYDGHRWYASAEQAGL